MWSKSGIKVLDDYEEEVSEVVGGKELLKWPSDLEARSCTVILKLLKEEGSLAWRGRQ